MSTNKTAVQPAVTQAANGKVPKDEQLALANDTEDEANEAAVVVDDPTNDQEYWVTVKCPLPPFPGVTIDVNVMANGHDMNALTNQLRNGQPQNLVRNVQGWNHEQYGEPFGNTAPMMFTVWASRDALAVGINQYITDPNSPTL